MRKLKYDYVVGTGGIGSGILFRFSDNITLGRNESRLAELMDVRDFCKLHIILHYVITYLNKSIPVYAIGRVGDDVSGREVLGLMEQYGINCRYVNVDSHEKTMYSVCFVYPDSDGGNITTSNSASGNMREEDIAAFFEQEQLKGRGLVLAAPEVPLDIRLYLLKKGRENSCFNVASFTSDEMGECISSGAFQYVDLLAINKHEMETLVTAGGVEAESGAPECYGFLRSQNPGIQLIVTQGGEGAQFFANGYSERIPAIWKPVNSTAGAGDCFLATVISGLICGVPFYEHDSSVGLGGLAALASSLKVTCKDTIDFTLDRERLKEEAARLGIDFLDKIKKLFLYTDQ